MESGHTNGHTILTVNQRRIARGQGRRGRSGQPSTKRRSRSRKAGGAASGTALTAVLRAAQAVAAQATFIEIEVETLEQLTEALNAGAKMVLLDNMPLPMLREAVRINAGRAILEISGGVTLEGLRELAETGVDRISIGTLTKDVKATDFSMRLQELA